MFSWKEAPKPVVALAPMSGITDAAFRQVVKEISPETIVFTEFLSTDALHYGSKKTMEMLQFDPELERPFIVQIFGNSPEHFISACRVIEEMGADGIDINMGCPAARVVSSCHGSALLRRPKLAAELVAAAVSTVHIPVSVKTRLGWENPEELIPFCKGLEEAGASLISVHGRTYKQKFEGAADWQPIYELKKNLRIPVIGNGDIHSAEDALEKIGNLDGVMIGRGGMGNPWVFAEVHNVLFERAPHQSATARSVRGESRSFMDKIPLLLRHAALAEKYKGSRGIIEMRKHLAQYVKGFDGAKELRMRLMGATSMSDVAEMIAPLMKTQ